MIDGIGGFPKRGGKERWNRVSCRGLCGGLYLLNTGRWKGGSFGWMTARPHSLRFARGLLTKVRQVAFGPWRLASGGAVPLLLDLEAPGRWRAFGTILHRSATGGGAGPWREGRSQ